MSPSARDVRVRGGTLRVHVFGDDDVGASLVLCVHGLSANARGFDPLGHALARPGRRVVAVDLRGRGFSPATAPGTYGWRNHAIDLLDLATLLGAERFDLVGHSMGAFIGMQLAAIEPKRLRRLALVDAAGFPEPAAMPPILGAVERLSGMQPSIEVYLDKVKGLGTIEPWSEHWERYFRYELLVTKEGVRARTSHHAVLEDVMYGSTQDPPALWPAITMPSLLVRAARPLGKGGGFIVRASDRDRFLRTVRGSTAVDVDANHYGVLMHERTLDAVGSFL